SESAAALSLPQFFLKIPANDLFGQEEAEVPVEKEHLLEGFSLSKADANIVFDNITAELYKVDLDETKKEHTPTFVRIDGDIKESVLAYILDPSRKDSRIDNTASVIMELIGKMDPIPDGEIKEYIKKVLADFTDAQFSDFYNQKYTYKDKIAAKIRALSESYAEKKFRDYLDTDKVYIKPYYRLPAQISP